MIAIPVEQGMALAAILFVLGLVGVIVRRNLLFMLICLEIMMNAAGLALIVAGQHVHQPDGQVMYILVLTLAAAEVSVGLGILLRLRHQHKTLDIDTASEMHG